MTRKMLRNGAKSTASDGQRSRGLFLDNSFARLHAWSPCLPLPGGSHEKCCGGIPRAFGLDCAGHGLPGEERTAGVEPTTRASGKNVQLFVPAALPHGRENVAVRRAEVHFAGENGGQTLGLSRDS